MHSSLSARLGCSLSVAWRSCKDAYLRNRLSCVLPGEAALRMLATDLRCLAALRSAADHHTLGDTARHVLRGHLFEEGEPGRLARCYDAGTRGLHRFRPGLVVLIRIAHRHAHIPRTPFGERKPGDARGALHVGERTGVLHLDTQHQLTARIQRPRIRAREILIDRDAPDLGGANLAAVATATHAEIRAQSRVERIA